MRSLRGRNIGREAALLYSRMLVVELLQAVQLVHELLLLSFSLVKRHARYVVRIALLLLFAVFLLLTP